MDVGEIVDRLRTTFGGAITAAFVEDKHPRVHTDAGHWRAIAERLRHDPAFDFDWLANLTGLDYAAEGKMAVGYDLWSVGRRHRFAVKVFADRAVPAVPSVVDLWPTANWHEREAFDLLGIDFPGHPHLRRILMAEDWDGHPLRKDYAFPRSYHGIPGSVELDWQQAGPAG